MADAEPRPPPRPSTVNAVSRALSLLRALNRQPVSTVEALFRHTGIPKPTIVRLLRTLEAEGLVRRAPQYGAYLLTSGVQDLTCGYHDAPRVVEAVGAVADALTAEIKWPVALGVLDTDAVVVRYSTIPASPLSLRHSSIGMRLSMVSRAIGKAYLAFCEPEEQAALLSLVAQSGEVEDAIARNRPVVLAILEQVRARGYALRDAGVRPMSQTLAVPIFENGRMVASIGMTWFSSVHSVETVVERFLPRLRSAADLAGARLVALTSLRPASPAAADSPFTPPASPPRRSPPRSSRRRPGR